jgi:hypothetical protein
MAKDHFIPAALIGRFSAETVCPYRDRHVAMARPGWSSSRIAAARNFGFANDLYAIGPDRTTDELWAYEGRLMRAIDEAVEGGPIGLEAWARVLVPFVASLFMRGREFKDRYQSRGSAALAEYMDPNLARAMEFQRLLAPVACARWVVFHRSEFADLLGSDIGIVHMRDRPNGEVGWAVPMDPHAALGIFPRDRRSVARFVDDRWCSSIEHVWDGDFDFDGLNNAISRSATEFIFGPKSTTVDKFLPSSFERAATDDQLYNWPYTSAELRNSEFEWHRLASLVGDSTSLPNVDFGRTTDFEELQQFWSGRIMLGVNAPPPHHGLSVRGRSIQMTMIPNPRPPGDYSISV